MWDPAFCTFFILPFMGLSKSSLATWLLRLLNSTVVLMHMWGPPFLITSLWLLSELRVWWMTSAVLLWIIFVRLLKWQKDHCAPLVRRAGPTWMRIIKKEFQRTFLMFNRECMRSTTRNLMLHPSNTYNSFLMCIVAGCLFFLRLSSRASLQTQGISLNLKDIL